VDVLADSDPPAVSSDPSSGDDEVANAEIGEE
jgi:hypothetical protein